MIRYEKLEYYVEGRKRYLSLKECGIHDLKETVSDVSFQSTDNEKPENYSERASCKAIETSRIMLKQTNSVWITKMKNNEMLMKSDLSKKSSNFFIPICVCIVSKYPYINTFTKMLEQMSIKKLSSFPLPLEAYIHYLVFAIPAIPRAFYKFQIQVSDNEMIDIVPPMPNALPMCDISFFPLAKSLTPDNILKVINHIILERPVLFVSSKIELLGTVIQSILALIFPFEYRMIYIPLLPQRLIDILQTSCPYLIGIHKSLYKSAARYIGASVLIVDIDNNELAYQERKWFQPSIMNYKAHVKIADMPAHEKKKLLHRVTSTLSKLKTFNELDIAKSNESEVLKNKLRDAFLLFFVSCLKSYESYLKFKNGKYKVDYKKLVKSVEEDYSCFLVQLTDTYMFSYWLYRKSHPKDYVSAYNMLFFDENVVAKLNRIRSIRNVKKVILVYYLGYSFLR